jgi:hypothetical protein
MTTAPAIVDVEIFMGWFLAMPVCHRESSIALNLVEKPGCSRCLAAAIGITASLSRRNNFTASHRATT